MGIESPLFSDEKGNIFKDFKELYNGCICCSAKDDLLKAVEYFIGDNSPYKGLLDYIVIECNGLADPCEYIKSLWTDD
jgi:G3E family GTPase